MRPFIGVDGEGRNLPNGYHAYFMLRAGDQTLWHKPIDQRLRTEDILNFLCDLDPDAIYVAYFFDYDVAKILEDLPWTKLDNLVHRERRIRNKGGYFPIDWNGFQVEYFPKKEFKVRRIRDTGNVDSAGTGNEASREYSPWIVINDTGTFFQSPFISTIRTWNIGTDTEREKVAEGKELRSEFSKITDAYVDEYNEIECRLLAELMTQFRDVCIELDYIPRKWQGPGQLAEAMLTKHGIPKNKDLELFNGPDVDLEYGVGAFGRYAYYGGWFEIPMVGYTPVPAIQWDINSAYPAALQDVPCLEHGTWERVTGKRVVSDDEISICFGIFTWDTDAKRPLLSGYQMRRDDGSIYRPLNGKGWYWSMEIKSAIHQEFTSYDSWVYHKHCDCTPFAFLKDLYRERKRLGKTTKGMVLKLIMNSVYGKLVQSIGNPTYSNPIWGSFITAWCRTKIAWLIHSLPACMHNSMDVPCGSDVYMVATDAIITRDYRYLDDVLDVNMELGNYSKEVHPNGLFIIQPGLYFDPKGEDTSTFYKTRGVPKKKVIEHRQEFLDAYALMVSSRDMHKGDVHLPFTLFLGIKQALVRKNMKVMGQFIDYKDPETGELGRRTSFDWKNKRRPQPMPTPDSLGSGIPDRLWTLPYWGRVDDLGNDARHGYLVQSVPYSKDIGGLMRNAEYREEFDLQPDWVSTQ